MKCAVGQGTVNAEIQDRPGTRNIERAAELAEECSVHRQSKITGITSMAEIQGQLDRRERFFST